MKRRESLESDLNIREQNPLRSGPTEGRGERALFISFPYMAEMFNQETSFRKRILRGACPVGGWASELPGEEQGTSYRAAPAWSRAQRVQKGQRDLLRTGSNVSRLKRRASPQFPAVSRMEFSHLFLVQVWFLLNL